MGISTVFGGNIYSFVTLSSRKRKHAFLRSISLFFFYSADKKSSSFSPWKMEKSVRGAPVKQAQMPSKEIILFYSGVLNKLFHFWLVPTVKIHLILTIISIISDFVILNYLNKNDVMLTVFLFKHVTVYVKTWQDISKKKRWSCTVTVMVYYTKYNT